MNRVSDYYVKQEKSKLERKYHIFIWKKFKLVLSHEGRTMRWEGDNTVKEKGEERVVELKPHEDRRGTVWGKEGTTGGVCVYRHGSRGRGWGRTKAVCIHHNEVHRFSCQLEKKLIEKKSSTPSLLAVCASVEECDYNSDVKRSHREIAIRGPAGQRLPSELGSMEDSLPSSPPALIWRMSWAWMPDLSLVGPLV